MGGGITELNQTLENVRRRVRMGRLAVALALGWGAAGAMAADSLVLGTGTDISGIRAGTYYRIISSVRFGDGARPAFWTRYTSSDGREFTFDASTEKFRELEPGTIRWKVGGEAFAPPPSEVIPVENGSRTIESKGVILSGEAATGGNPAKLNISGVQQGTITVTRSNIRSSNLEIRVEITPPPAPSENQNVILSGVAAGESDFDAVNKAQMKTQITNAVDVEKTAREDGDNALKRDLGAVSDIAQDADRLSQTNRDNITTLQSDLGTTTGIAKAADKLSQENKTALDELERAQGGLMQDIAANREGLAQATDRVGALEQAQGAVAQEVAANRDAVAETQEAIRRLDVQGARYASIHSDAALAQAQGEESVAIGGGAVAASAGGVALGSGARATRAAGRAGYVEDSAPAAHREAVARTTATAGAVAIGDDGEERDADTKRPLSLMAAGDSADAPPPVLRQITGVAAGSIGTDAVNVAQLRATNARIQEVERAVYGRLGKLEEKSYSGTALALALNGSYLPPVSAGKQALGVGLGSYQGYHAIGVTYKGVSQSGNLSWGAGIGGSDRAVGFSAGMGVTW